MGPFPSGGVRGCHGLHLTRNLSASGYIASLRAAAWGLDAGVTVLLCTATTSEPGRWLGGWLVVAGGQQNGGLCFLKILLKEKEGNDPIWKWLINIDYGHFELSGVSTSQWHSGMVEEDGKKDMDMYKYYSPSSGTEAWVHASAPQTACFTGRTEVTPTANDQPLLPSPNYFSSILVTWLPQNAGFGAVDPGQYIIICLRDYRSSGAGSWKGRGRRMAVEREGPAWEGGLHPQAIYQYPWSSGGIGAIRLIPKPVTCN